MITAYNKKSKQLTQVEHSFSLKPASDWIVNPLIENYDQLVQAPSDTWTYDEDTTILRVLTPEEMDIDPERISFARREQIGMISNRCEREITKGFLCDCLGLHFWYDASSIDQLNLISSITLTSPTLENPSGSSVFYPCRDSAGDPAKQYQSHTYAQLQKVMAAGSISRLTYLQQFSALKQLVLNAKSVTEVKSITWETL